MTRNPHLDLYGPYGPAGARSEAARAVRRSRSHRFYQGRRTGRTFDEVFATFGRFRFPGDRRRMGGYWIG